MINHKLGVVLRLLLMVSVCGLLLFSCDSSNPDEEPPPPDGENENVVQSVVVSADKQRVIGTGIDIQLTAIALNAQGDAVPGVEFVWTSANPEVATVEEGGEVVTTGLGKVRIQAETAGISGSIEIEALPAGIQQLSLSTPYQVLPHDGFAVQLDLTALDALGDPVADPQVSWSSSNANVISVDNTGQITTINPGSAIIFVESDNTETLLHFDVVTTTGTGILELDLAFLTIFKGINSADLLIAPPGMSVALAVDGRLVMARGYGMASSGTDASGALLDPVQPNSLFRIASVSKPFTAVSVLKLVEQDRLSLEDSLLSIIPSLIPSAGLADEEAREIKIWGLLEHKGGWDRSVGPNPLYHLPVIAQEMGVASPPSHESVAQWLFGQELDFRPGSRYTYNNMNYFMLGQVIEAVTGQPYDAFVKQEVLAPIGITTMHIGGTMLEDRAEGEVEYFYGGLGASVFDGVPGTLPTQYGGGFDMNLMNASGGWIASAIDLVRFGLAVDSRSVITDSQLHDYMFSDNSGSGVYGAGWILDNRNYLHTGALEGSSSLLYVFDNGTVLALLFNGNTDVSFRRWLEPIIETTDWPDIDLFGQY